VELESVREALFAEKGAENEGLELPADRTEFEQSEVPAETAPPAGPGPLGAFGGGLFAEKLKVALKKKRGEKAEEPDKPDETA